jgi:hypothetical protein
VKLSFLFNSENSVIHSYLYNNTLVTQILQYMDRLRVILRQIDRWSVVLRQTDRQEPTPKTHGVQSKS